MYLLMIDRAKRRFFHTPFADVSGPPALSEIYEESAIPLSLSHWEWLPEL